jgi:hypothetical protein
MAVLLHPVREGVRVPRIVFSTEYEQRTLAEDREIIERILGAYHHAIGSASARTRRSMFGTIWAADGFGGRQRDLVEALEARSAERAHGILRRFLISDAAYGIAMGREEADAVRNDPALAHGYGLMWLDQLVGLAGASGAHPLINPEDNLAGWERALLDVDVDAVVASIEETFGIRLEFPDMTGVFGGELRGKPVPSLAFMHLLVALGVRPWMPEQGKGHVVEIGGGFGDLAYWTGRLLRCRYTIYDLPFVNAAQAYFLWRALPGRPLRLAGEQPGAGDEIALLPGWLLIQEPPASADVVINQNSLVEIPRATARAYLTAIRGFLDGPFLSINHESWQRMADALDRTSVAESMAAVGGYTRVSRAPFALRVGYVQEIYARSGATLRVGSSDGRRVVASPAAAPTLKRLKRLLSR